MSAGTMWEPFTKPARTVIARVQETAQLFGSPVIGIEHFLFALAGGDDELAAVFARALDRDAVKARLGAVGREPTDETTFAEPAKHAIALSFQHALRLGQHFISAPHLALGVIEAEPPPLTDAVTLDEVRDEVERLARAYDGGAPTPTP
jgi:ATP-dependent Clp protease ATP-binding subunit ClpA